jgi:hypothetical protein
MFFIVKLVFYRSKGGLLMMLAALLVLSLSAFGQEAPKPKAEPEDPNFTFSVFYAGNMRGNLEPCG